MTPTSQDTNDTILPEESLQEPLNSLSDELGRISAEIRSINAGFQGQMQQVLTQTHVALEKQYQDKLKKSVEDLREQLRDQIEAELRKGFEAEFQARLGHLNEVQREIDRVAARLEGVAQEIAAMLDDPSIELAKVIRVRTEQAELQAYLNGLHFSAGESQKSKTASGQ